MKPPIAAATGIEAFFLGRILRTKRNAPYPVQTPTIDMLNVLAPKAVNPPSANKNACISRTIVRAKVAAHGPTKIAANAPPIK